MTRVLVLLGAAAVISVGAADHVSAAQRGNLPTAASAAKPSRITTAPPPKTNPATIAKPPKTNPPAAKPAKAPTANERTAGRTGRAQANVAVRHREEKGRRPLSAFAVHTHAIARNGLPRRPLPGEAGFTGVPPRGERRFVANEMVFHIGPSVSRQAVEDAARRLGLTPLASQSLTVTGGTLFRFRLAEGRRVADAVRALEAEKLGTAQPNYVYLLQQDSGPQLPPGDAAQYTVSKLRLADVHRLATGKDVRVAVIDSRVDAAHPDLDGAVADEFAADSSSDKPDNHGTGMAGAIAAHRKLLGVAPGVRILAVHAFSPDHQRSGQATTQHILAGIDWAIENGARVINMSVAGPYDPMLQLALKKAHDQGIVLIAAAGNMGPRSTPLYPAADENVIAVTAVDVDDRLLPQANQGPHIALAAPGVNVLEPAANAGYQLTTGTSVAAAHVSGVAALLIERRPQIDFAALEEVLFTTAKDLGAKGRDSQFGFGLVDPYRALNELAEKVAADR